MTRLLQCLSIALLLLVEPTAASIIINLDYVDTNAAAYDRFETWVDQGEQGNPGYEFSATDTAYAYQLRGLNIDCTTAVNMVQAQVDEAHQVIIGGSRPPVAGDSYLEVGNYIGALALTYDWCEAFTTAQQRSQWEAYADQAIFNVWNPNDASWEGQPYPWSGWSINNPGNNYYYSFVGATLYWGLAANRTQWITFLENEKWPPLVTYFSQLQGGGSPEGTGYGTAHMRLFELYRVWRDSTGTDLANVSSHLTDSIDYWIHATVPTMEKFAPIGDQSRVSEPILFDYQRNLVLQARQATNDVAAKERATMWLNTISVQNMTHGFNFRHDLIPAGNSGALPANLFHHASGVGHFFARSGWETDAMWMSFVAGPYTESHAHKDQGSFTLYVNDWLAVTENIWTHSGIQQGAKVHNVLRFENSSGEVLQREGTLSTLSVSTSGSGISGVADLTPAYDGDPRVGNWQRTFSFANRSLTLEDTYTVTAGTQATFQINVPEEPNIIDANTVIAGGLRIRIETPTTPTLSVLNWSTVEPGEYQSGYRLDIGGGNGNYRIVLDELQPPSDIIFANGFD